MKFQIKHILLFLIFSFILSKAFSQEILSGLEYNPLLLSKKIKKETKAKTKSSKSNALFLPFVDDFAYNSIFPNQDLWADKYVIIDHDFSKKPITIGVATFDGINDSGTHYPNPGTTPYIADYLTSNSIRLDIDTSNTSLYPSDSVFLSFFYRPGGDGGYADLYSTAPGENDSLVLEFSYKTNDSIDVYIDTALFIVDTLLLSDDTIFNKWFGNWIKINPFLRETDSILLPGDTIYLSIDSARIIITEIMKSGDSIYYENDSIWVSIDFNLRNNIKLLEKGDSIWIPKDTIKSVSTKWKWIWSTKGMPFDTFYAKNNVDFKYISIPITDSNYFFDNFQFRFKNYSTQRINTSGKDQNIFFSNQWHLDYIYLDQGRQIADSSFIVDAGYTTNITTLIQNYQEMPLWQYMMDPSKILSDITVEYTNFCDDSMYIDRNMTIKNIKTQKVELFEGYSVKLLDKQTLNYSPKIGNFTFYDSKKEFAEFDIKIFFNDRNDQNNVNDTISFVQYFRNFYAYDDGIPEAAYGFGLYGGKAGIKYDVISADTLTAINIYFVKTNNNTNAQGFYLCVWDNNNGIPGTELYRERVYLKKTDDFHTFLTYYLANPIIVNNSYFIGFEQTEDESLNIGYDRNHNFQKKIYYYNYNTFKWTNTIHEGALMMRPVFRSNFGPFGIEEKHISTHENSDFLIYPNPSNKNYVLIKKRHNLHINEEASLYINIYDIKGKCLLKSDYIERIDISNFKNGLYLVKLTNYKTGSSENHKLIINK